MRGVFSAVAPLKGQTPDGSCPKPATILTLSQSRIQKKWPLHRGQGEQTIALSDCCDNHKVSAQLESSSVKLHYFLCRRILVHVEDGGVTGTWVQSTEVPRRPILGVLT